MKTRSRPAMALILILFAGTAAAQVPSTDVFVFRVDGTSLGDPLRVTDREGYDNQPKFLPGGNSLATCCPTPRRMI